MGGTEEVNKEIIGEVMNNNSIDQLNIEDSLENS